MYTLQLNELSAFEFIVYHFSVEFLGFAKCSSSQLTSIELWETNGIFQREIKSLKVKYIFMREELQPLVLIFYLREWNT